ncbi:hypothetical protein J8I29_12190 [Labrys sp. LIt4]|uniref:hypothetical protein n=1 Tax=Labrys sp. LIt4 TaxID=2821355 RepID=UPI001ADFA032|nr:hypothetical protein [Labrys sp. LIt4]MBP0580072.1 hypothetical protein [Labrys sp. LIt4]
MSRQSLLRTGLVAALIMGSLAGSISTSFAASTGPGSASSGGNGGGGGGNRGSGPSNPGGGGGGGGGGGMSDEARVIITNPPPCRTHACNPPRPRPAPVPVQLKFVDQQRCTNVWRQVVLDDGSVIEDRSAPMRKHCRIIRSFN